MTENKKDQAKRKFHCACATGDLSAVQPVTASPAEGTTAKPDGSKGSKPAAAATPGSVGQQKTSG